MYENSDFAVRRFGECSASDNRLKVKEVCKRACEESSFSKFEAKGFNFQDMYQDFFFVSYSLFQVIPDKENSRLNQNSGGESQVFSTIWLLLNNGFIENFTLCRSGSLRR